MNILQDLKQQYHTGGIVQKLIFWNIGVFLLSLPLFYQFSSGYFVFPKWLALSGNYNTALPFFWTFISYQFLHGGVLHLIFNLIILNFSGQLFLTFFSSRQLLGVYFLGGFFGGLLFVLAFTLLPLGEALLIGASASVMSLLFTVVGYNPLMEVRLLLIGRVKLWHIASVLLILDILQIGLSNTGGHIAHLGGALFGLLYITLLKKGTDLTAFIYKINRLSLKKNYKIKRSHNNLTVHINPKYSKSKSYKTHQTQPKKDKIQQQIDEILDKISQSGYDSLTKEEKEFLFKQK